MQKRIVSVLRDNVGRKQSTGIIVVQDENAKVLFTCQSLERGWVSNKKNVSCIPAGKYTLRFEFSPKFNTDLWEIYGVPNRSECKFHAANFWHELNGCIAPGVTQKDLDHDNLVDNIESKKALAGFHKAMEGFITGEIRIINSQFN